MPKMFMIVHAQSHSGTKGTVVRDADGNIIGHRKTTETGTVTTFTKKAQKNATKGGNTGTGGTGRG